MPRESWWWTAEGLSRSHSKSRVRISAETQHCCTKQQAQTALCCLSPFPGQGETKLTRSFLPLSRTRISSSHLSVGGTMVLGVLQGSLSGGI